MSQILNLFSSFQVTISATEDSLLISWPHRRLKNHLATDSVFDNIFDQLIGKDISHKLYQIQEKLLSNPDYMETLASRRSSMVNVRNSIVSMSAVNLTKLNCLQGMVDSTCIPVHVITAPPVKRHANGASLVGR